MTGKTNLGVKCGMMRVGEFNDEPNDTHRDKSHDKHEKTTNDVKNAFHEARRDRSERGNFRKNSWSIADEFEIAELREEGGFAGDEIVRDVISERFFINVVGII